ncbi:MAG TPA: type II toxin-antitoxin system RelE/ParE family toxin [Candidatus Acidoferrales bacterium]|nr:type II toxin-antitoxin system RelE/ParE family toxin [Candidatus Acidoferrales bacterium]
MAYRVEFAESAERELKKLDPQPRIRILEFLRDRVAKLDGPRAIGKALKGSELGEFWRYRVGELRLICRIEDERVLILVLRIGHRREIYR